MPLTRRRFLQSATALTAAPLLRAEPAAASSREPLQQLPYSVVQLTDGPFAEQYRAVHAHYLALSNDRLLKVYRQRAGMLAPGDDMGGWYDLDGFVPGHTLGQYISGLARLGTTTADPATREKVAALVEGFAATLGPGNQSILRPATNLWICYTLDKHFAGLIDAATLAGVADANPLLSRVLAGAEPLLPARGRDRIGKKDPPYDETFVLPENLFLAGQLTGNPAFTRLAHRYLLDRELYDPLARGEDPFPGQHAYSHAIALSSAGQAYLQEGDARYRSAMQNAFSLLTTTQQFASGGWGPNETFITPHRGELYASLSTTVDHFETPCGAYAATKLARYLLRTAVPRDTTHADNLERVLFNTILAVRPPDSDGDYPYYSTYSPVATKVYYPKKWPCCSGTLVQTVADYVLNLYFYRPATNSTREAVYVSGYTPSQARLNIGPVSVHLLQETRFPAEDTTLLTLQPERPVAFQLLLRLPTWLAGSSSPQVRINGKSIPTPTAQPGTWLTLDRTWHPGDRVELLLPQHFRTEPIDDRNPRVVALMRGPVQYVALNPAHDLADARLTLPSSLRPVGPQTYLETYAGQQVVFVPLYQVRNETYTTYFHQA